MGTPGGRLNLGKTKREACYSDLSFVMNVSLPVAYLATLVILNSVRRFCWNSSSVVALGTTGLVAP